MIKVHSFDNAYQIIDWVDENIYISGKPWKS